VSKQAFSITAFISVLWLLNQTTAEIANYCTAVCFYSSYVL